MLAFVSGILEQCGKDAIVVDANGIGYNIMVPVSVTERLPRVGSKVKIYTYMSVREDAVKLYGFLDRDGLETFKLLIAVNGIGPKAAMGILSALSPDEIRFAVLSDNAAAIAKAPGIGPKTAGKIILELKDRVDLEQAFEIKSGHFQSREGGFADGDAVMREDAVQALVALGYSQGDAAYAVSRVGITEGMTDSDILKEALRHM